MKPDVSKLIRINLPNRDELSFLTVLALPNAINERKRRKIELPSRRTHLRELDSLEVVEIQVHPKSMTYEK